MEKIDLKQKLKYLYSPSVKKVEVVDVPEFQFLMMDGQIEPGSSPSTSPGFEKAVEALYGLAYNLKFISKQRAVNPIDYPVMALEGLWWIEGGQFEFNPHVAWLWTLMILQPDHITKDMFETAIGKQKAKRDSPALDEVRLGRFHEGLCMQVMHIGPYSEEPKTIEKMMEFAETEGYQLHGKHHEIYLGDPRRAKPENLKTILRLPISR